MADNDAEMKTEEVPAGEAAAAADAPAEASPAADAEGKVPEVADEKESAPAVPATDAAAEPTAIKQEVDTNAPRLNKNSLPIRAYLDQTVVPVLLQVRVLLHD